MRPDRRDTFKNPPTAYRPVPFWSWNDDLEPDELRRQIREMKKAGLGGYFMHARGGLITHFMGDKWMDCIDASIDEGEKQSMYAWCYDEDGWPSGFAGGAVTALGDEYHVRWLELTRYDPAAGVPLESDAGTLGFYVAAPESGQIEYVKPAAWSPERAPAAAAAGASVYRIAQRSNPGYIDILNKKTVHAFLEVIHEKYFARFEKYFGGVMPGFFTDEPQHAMRGMPWSYILPESFAGRYGFDPIPRLIELYIDAPGAAEFRWKFQYTVSALFTEAFMKQVYEWCEAHGCELTGHLMEEESLQAQVRATGGVMPSYEYMHRPGIDWLCRRISSPFTPRQVGSAAQQLGKKFVLSEMFALCGWDVSFEELKWIAEWQYVNGVNMMCQHLESYSIRGLRKRDYPPSMFYQMSWWDEYSRFNDYFSRLGMLLQEGRSGADVLVVHPMRSAWITWTGGPNETIRKLDGDILRTIGALSAAHTEWHFGDEAIMEKHGSVDGKNIRVGLCSYSTVVLPPMPDISRTTLELLAAFVKAGGHVIAMGGLPATVEGIADEAALAALAGLAAGATQVAEITPDAFLAAYSKHSTPRIRITEAASGSHAGNIHLQERVTDEGSYFFIVNTDNATAYQAVIEVEGCGGITLISLEDGEETVTTAGGTVTLDFAPMQSYMIFAHNAKPAASKTPEASAETVVLAPPHEWRVADMGLNSYTLDFCEWSVDGGDWQKPLPPLAVFDVLLNMHKNSRFAMRFTFEADLDPAACSELYLVAEAPLKFDMTLNGKEVTHSDSGTWKDINFMKLDIKPLLLRGSNELVVSGEFFQSAHVYDVIFGKDVLETEVNKLTYDTELENFYLLGDFLVFSRDGYAEGDRKALTTDGPFVLKQRPRGMTLRSGDMTTQGLCFFAETLKLAHTERISPKGGTRYFWRMKKPFAPMAKLYVNGEFVRALLWAPYEADITPYLLDGDNVIEVELFAGNRNVFGPHHHAQGELYAVSPQSFRERPFVTEGELNPKYRRDYAFVKFGIDI